METKLMVKEFNKVITLDEPLAKSADEKALYNAVKEFREPEDKFSDEFEKAFAELEAKYGKKKDKKADKAETKPEKEKDKKKDKEKVVVKAGVTVEMEPDDDDVKVEKPKKEKEMKQEKVAEKPVEKPKKEKGEKPEVKIIRAILDRQVKKDALENLIKTEPAFADVKKKLLKESNFMSLKKKMLDVFDEDLVKELRAELPPISHEKKDKAPVEKESALVKGIKESTKVKQLKSIAKANEQFNWKKLKKLEDFEPIQKAMLKVAGGGKAEPKAEPKVKMVPNPMIAEINAFEKKKKLRKWAAEQKAFAKVDLEDFDDLDEMKEALIEKIPAEVEAKGGGKVAGAPRRESNWSERKEMMTKLIEAAEYTRAEIAAKMNSKYPGFEKDHSNRLSECKNPERWEKFSGLDKLVKVNGEGIYKFSKK